LAEIFAKLRWAVRRRLLRNLWRRINQPFRRRRQRRKNLRATLPFAKDPLARATAGPAVVFGEFAGLHGLGRAAAYDLELVRARHSAVTSVDIGPYLRGRPAGQFALGEPFDNAYFLCQPDKYALICRMLSPDALARAYRVGRWVWETPLFPSDWRFAERMVHEVWTPSEFCARVFRAALEVPVRVVPHAATTPPETGLDIRAGLGVPTLAFMGLAIMDIEHCPERKNPWAHVRAWKRAFGDDPDKILVMKLRVGKRTRVVLDELSELIDGAKNVRILTADLSNEEIAALHRAANVYVSLHRSEGFGLNIYESLLLGKPVVATDWSANAEYGPGFATYLPVAYKLERNKDWLAHYADGNFCWASADVADAARLLRAVAGRAGRVALAT
jgi:glycosyltransferase involved in cell wall biosynthesis